MMAIGDLSHHHILLLKKPTWSFRFDNDQNKPPKTRAGCSTMICRAGRHQIASFHFPFLGNGHLTRRKRIQLDSEIDDDVIVRRGVVVAQLRRLRFETAQTPFARAGGLQNIVVSKRLSICLWRSSTTRQGQPISRESERGPVDTVPESRSGRDRSRSRNCADTDHRSGRLEGPRLHRATLEEKRKWTPV